MTPDTLQQLTRDDRERLSEKARPQRYAPGETILAEGSERRALFVLRSGFVRVEQGEKGRGIALARLGPGEQFGEMSFLERSGATASVVAEDEVEVDLIEEADVQSLLASDPGFSTRFYHSLALTLADRLRTTSARLTQLGGPGVEQADRSDEPRVGQVTDRQLPADMVGQVDALKERMGAVARQATADERTDGSIAIARACGELAECLQRYTHPAQLLETAYDDLLSFREPAALARGIGGYVFRETFPLFMTSATIARCYARPCGPDDHETIARLYRNEAEGDGPLGRWIDAWFLARPFATSRREMRDLVVGLLREAISGATPASVTCLASGTAEELFLLAADPAQRTFHAACIDRDQGALSSTKERAERRGLAESMLFIREDVLAIAAGRGRVALPPQSLMYAIGLLEYLTDDEAVALIDWAHGQLHPGGTVALSTLGAPHPDQSFVEHILDWQMECRSEDSLRGLFGRSAFRDAPLRVLKTETGHHLLATCSKPGA